MILWEILCLVTFWKILLSSFINPIRALFPSVLMTLSNFRTDYIPAEAYAQSKLAQILFTNYLDKLINKSAQHIQIHSVHPGVVNTDLFNGTNLKKFAPWMPSLFFKVRLQRF